MEKQTEAIKPEQYRKNGGVKGDEQERMSATALLLVKYELPKLFHSFEFS